MNTWVFEEYFGLPITLYKLQRENIRNTPGITREKVRFGEDEHQYVLIMRPAEWPKPRRNTVFFIHGGGWAIGSPESFAFVGSFFAKQGFNVILGGYRHAPKYKYPMQLEDVCRGLVRGIEVLKEHGDEADRIIVSGESAGAQLAGLLVLDDENIKKRGIDPEIFSAMILISGLMDFSTCNAKQVRLVLRGFLADDADYVEADPIRLVNGNTRRPVLCIHGNRDPLVDIKNSINFYNRIKTGCEGESKLVIAKGRHHVDLLELFIKNIDVTRALEDFMHKIENNVNK